MKSWLLRASLAINQGFLHSHSRVIFVFQFLCQSLPSKKTELLLRNALANNPTARRGQLQDYLWQNMFTLRFESAGNAEKLNGKATLSDFERFQRAAVSPYTDEQFPLQEDVAFSEIEDLLGDIVKEYSDFQSTDWDVGSQ